MSILLYKKNKIKYMGIKILSNQLPDDDMNLTGGNSNKNIIDEKKLQLIDKNTKSSQIAIHEDNDKIVNNIADKGLEPGKMAIRGEKEYKKVTSGRIVEYIKPILTDTRVSKAVQQGGKKRTDEEYKNMCNMGREQLKKMGQNTNSFIKREDLNNDPKEYIIHYNDGRPFKVIAKKEKIEVFTFKDSTDNYEDLVYDINVLSINNFLGLWPGFDASECAAYARDHGNTVLIQETKTSYIYVGANISQFETDDEILDYLSPLGNSDVPYPVAYSRKYVFFMLDNMYVNKDQLKTPALLINSEKIYAEFYGALYPGDHIEKNQMKNYKILVKEMS